MLVYSKALQMCNLLHMLRETLLAPELMARCVLPHLLSGMTVMQQVQVSNREQCKACSQASSSANNKQTYETSELDLRQSHATCTAGTSQI